MEDFESEPLLIERSELSQNVKVSPIKSEDVPKKLPLAQPRFTLSDKQSLILITLFVTFAALANLVRFFLNIPVSIGTMTFPGWTGAIAYLVLGLLAAWSFRGIKAASFPRPTDRSDRLE